MKQVQKLIFFLALIQLIYCQKLCKINKTDSTCYSPDEDTYSCIGDIDTGCLSVPSCENAGSTEKNCPIYPVSKNRAGTYICMNRNDYQAKINPCQEVQLCLFLTGDLTDDICREHPVTPELAKNHTCILNIKTGTCEEILNCNKVPKSEDSSCSDFAHDVRKLCIENENGDTKCREEFICGKEDVYGVSERDCMNHLVSDDKNFICLKKDFYYCEERPLCTKVVTTQMLTDANCSTYGVAKEHYGTHTCVKDPNKNACIEQVPCEKAPQNVTCSNYQVSWNRKGSYYCALNTGGGNNYCKEFPYCSAVTSGNYNEDQCKNYPISNRESRGDFVCIPKARAGCIEIERCDKGRIRDDKICSDYPVMDKRKACVENKDWSGHCIENIICNKANEGESDIQCMNYLVTNDTKFICLKTDETSGPSCKEYQLCETIKGESLTDSDCKKYPVSKKQYE